MLDVDNKNVTRQTKQKLQSAETNETQVLNVFDSHFNIWIMFNYPMFSSQF
jgi:hypothetical protein